MQTGRPTTVVGGGAIARECHQPEGREADPKKFFQAAFLFKVNHSLADPDVVATHNPANSSGRACGDVRKMLPE
ncbi:MAG: hypothetical protein DWI21_19000 [Planctomycetota bacterium]|nr:MAG: hypothetical protein DWI21_19000 [Planctomycetota bacterium]GDY09860.1 hypothetical protein LBMAG52_33460 [Planctomycetia bacterium]